MGILGMENYSLVGGCEICTRCMFRTSQCLCFSCTWSHMILSNFRMGMSSVGTTGSWAAVKSVCGHVMFRTMAYFSCSWWCHVTLLVEMVLCRCWSWQEMLQETTRRIA
jgi:hypothetical protein